MNKANTTTQSNLTDESREMLIQMGINPDNAPVEEILEEPYEEEVMVLEEETVEKKSVNLAEIFVLDEDAVKEEPEEKVVFTEVEEEMIRLLKEKSRDLSSKCFFIEKLDGNEIPFGNFNGAGDRAITQYQPEHPDAPQSGRNYGKVFYRWTDSRVKDVLYAIFEQAQKNALMHEILFGEPEKPEEPEEGVKEEQ